MIGRLIGKLIEKSPGLVLLEVSGVAYEVEVSAITFDNLPGIDETLILHTHMVVREDAQLLFGFIARGERDLFRLLIKVNGVGPKLGLTILSGMDAVSFARCVKNKDVQSLVGLPGVGKKTAERLVIEVRDKLDEWADFSSEITILKPKGKANLRDAETALINLGYRPQEAAAALAQIDFLEDEHEDEHEGQDQADDMSSVEQILKRALRVLAG